LFVCIYTLSGIEISLYERVGQVYDVDVDDDDDDECMRNANRPRDEKIKNTTHAFG
jgi:hypothetical protein